MGKLDLRSLAVFRVCLALLVLKVMAELAPDFSVFYRQLGSNTIPVGLLELILWTLPLSAGLLLLGFLTRLSTLLCGAGLVFLQQANPQILQGGDFLLRLLLFWSLFLPLGAVWSIDSRRGKKPWLPSTPITQAASWALTLQICQVYWAASLLKTDPLWTRSGNALFFALNIEHFTTPLGLYLRQYPDLLRVFTLGTPWFELIGPLLLFVPVHRDACRLIAVVLFVSFHLLGMEALLRIGLFPWVCAAAWLVFLPGSFWDRLEAKAVALFKSKPAKPLSAARGEETSPNHLRPALVCLVLFFIIASFMDVLAWNMASLAGTTPQQWMQEHDEYAHVLHLDQRWNMYAPYPRKEHGWLIVPADLADGSQVDLFTSQPVSWEKPKDLGDYFGDDRWRRYLSNLFDDQDPKALQAYADYLVRKWNQHHEDKKVQVVTIIFMKEETQEDLTVTSPKKDILLFHAY